MNQAMSLGQNVVTLNPIKIPSCAILIERGEEGRVIDVDPDDGTVIVQLHRYHDTLVDRRNYVVIKNPSKDIRIKRGVIREIWLRESRMPIAVAASLLAFMIGAQLANARYAAAQERENILNTVTRIESELKTIFGD